MKDYGRDLDGFCKAGFREVKQVWHDNSYTLTGYIQGVPVAIVLVLTY